MDPSRWGVEPGYYDYAGQWRDAPPQTVQAILETMGALDLDPSRAPDVLVVTPDQRPTVRGPAELTTEDGAVVRVEGETLPPDLPFGYHRLRWLDDGRTARVVASPGRCHLPADLLTWGWTVQLYAARSAASWGIGDLADLATLTQWSSEMGAGFVAVNPLHAPLPTDRQQASPYFPSSRLYRNPLYLRVEEVPGASAAGVDLAALTAAGRELLDDRRIDRDAVWRLKREALQLLWSRFPGDPAFDAWRADEGDVLRSYATFCVLVEEHGRGWNGWPVEHRRLDTSAVARFADDHRDRVAFHEWLQWLLDRQLEAASSVTPVVHDLAVGVDPAGADAWLWQDAVADGFRVGAPPDEFVTRGQDWAVAAFDPWQLRASGHEPVARTLRASFRHAGGLRIDHVMGLSRLFWVPPEGGPPAGTYVRYPFDELLAVLTLESHRAGAFVVGEDLGTVEEGVREQLADGGVLSYRLVWFGESPPSAYPQQALAAVTTHDLATVAGLWTGSDLEAQRAAGVQPNEEATARLRGRVQQSLGVPDDAPVGDVVRAVYGWLAEAPSMLLSATLDDALEVEERPNMPGTVDEWPNWSLALPLPLEDVLADARPTEIADRLSRREPSSSEAGA